jgi:hypothetical protein
MNKLLGAAAAACVASGAALAQPEVELFATTDPEKQLMDRMTELRAQGGPTAAGLIEPLRAVALLYQENGDDALAALAFEDARYVTRVHQGLASAEEALLLRQQIRSELRLGRNERARALEQEMVTIARRHHDDVRMLPIFRELVDDRLALIEEVRAGRRPRMIYVRCYNGEPLPPYDYTRGEWRPPVPPAGTTGFTSPSCIGGTNSQISDKLRAEILMFYADSIDIILRTGDYASHELRQLEKAALAMAYFGRGFALPSRETDVSFPLPCPGGTLDHYLALDILDSCLAPVRRGPNFVSSNVGGRIGLVRLLAYEIRSAAPAAARASAIVDLADWHLVAVPADRRRFSTIDELALAFYERAYRELQQGGDADASTAQIFAPEIPVTLPTFEPNPFAAATAADTTANSARYIDVAFAITQHGTGEQIEVLAMSKDATREAKRDLIRLIESTTFRPRVVDGELASSARITLRYHLGYSITR